MADTIEVDMIVEAISKNFDKVSGDLGKVDKSAAGLNKTITSGNATFGKFGQQLKSAIIPAIGIGVAVGKLTQFIKGSIEKTEKYILDMRDLSKQWKISVEDTSRLVQVSQDLRISQEELTAAFRIMQQKGIQPTIENLAKLADEYLTYKDSTAAAQFMNDRLGRGWTKLLPLFSKGGQAIRDITAATLASLVVTEKAIKQAEDYHAAVDQMTDAWEAFSQVVGLKAMNAITRLLGGLEEQQRIEAAIYEAKKKSLITWAEFDKLLGMARSSAFEYDEVMMEVMRHTIGASDATTIAAYVLRDYTKKLDETAAATDETADYAQRYAQRLREEGHAAWEAKQANDALAGSLRDQMVGAMADVQTAMDNFGKSVGEKVGGAFAQIYKEGSPKLIEAYGLIDEAAGTSLKPQAELNKAADELAKAYAAGKLSGQELQDKIGELTEEYAPHDDAVKESTKNLGLLWDQYKAVIDLPDRIDFWVYAHWANLGNPPAGIGGGGGTNTPPYTPPPRPDQQSGLTINGGVNVTAGQGANGAQLAQAMLVSISRTVNNRRRTGRSLYSGG